MKETAIRTKKVRQKGALMSRTRVKGDTVNKGDVTARFVGRNLTIVGERRSSDEGQE